MRIDLGLILGVFLEFLIMIYYANTTLYPRKNYYVSSVIDLIGYIAIFVIAVFGHMLINLFAFAAVNIVILILGYNIKSSNAVFRSITLTILSFLGECMIMFLIGLTFSTNSLMVMSPNPSPEASMLVTIAGKLIYFVGVLIIKGIEHNKKHYAESSFLLLVSVPIVTLITIWIVLGTNVDKWIFTIVCLVSIVINVLIFSVSEFIVSKNDKIRALEKENSKNLIALEEYKHLSEKYEENRIFRHDLKEHIHVLQSLISNHNTDAINYLRDMEKLSEEIELVKYSENSILNMLLIQKNKECNEHGIKLHIHSSNPCFDFFDEMDIVSIFSNLINNAMESCLVSEGKDIFLELYTGNKAFTVIKIENSSDKEPIISNDILITSKDDKYRHGLGIKSIKNALKKYNGNISWSYDRSNKIFRTTILINTTNL